MALKQSGLRYPDWLECLLVFEVIKKDSTASVNQTTLDFQKSNNTRIALMRKSFQLSAVQPEYCKHFWENSELRSSLPVKSIITSTHHNFIFWCRNIETSYYSPSLQAWNPMTATPCKHLRVTLEWRFATPLNAVHF